MIEDLEKDDKDLFKNNKDKNNKENRFEIKDENEKILDESKKDESKEKELFEKNVELENSSKELKDLHKTSQDGKSKFIKSGKKFYDSLQAAIDDIDSGVIEISKDLRESKSIIIPANKKIEIKDDGEKREIIRSSHDNNNPLFIIEKGGELTLKATSNDNLTLKPDQHTGLFNFINRTGNIIDNKGVFNLESGTIWCGSFKKMQNLWVVFI